MSYEKCILSLVVNCKITEADTVCGVHTQYAAVLWCERVDFTKQE